MPSKVIVFPLGMQPGDLLAMRVLTSRQASQVWHEDYG